MHGCWSGRRTHLQLVMHAGRPTKGGNLRRAEADILTLGDSCCAGPGWRVLAGRVGGAILRAWQEGEGHQ